jgi:hypothetical protein
MRVTNERELLGLWEIGQARHPIDRALLLCAWAQPDIAPDRVAHLPLGVVNRYLLKMRRALFGPRIEARVACEECGELLEIDLAVEQLLAGAEDSHEGTELEIDGFRFRLPDSSDLAAVAHELDPQAGAEKLLERCCIARPPEAGASLTWVMDKAEAALEAADPIADLQLAVACETCGHRWQTQLDPGTLLWDELQAYARGVLGQVHALAQAYGWTEAEILALSPQRRATYLGMVGG